MLRLDDLQYKGLKIYQDTEEFCFGTDAVLLASFAAVRKGERIADLCSGTGIVALLACARCAPLSCLAVELQQHMAELCTRSVEYNGMQQQITVKCADIRTLGFKNEAGSMDAVLCNPPYMPADGALLSGKENLRIARQEVACTLKDVLEAAKRLLRFGGRLAMVHQSQRIMDILAGMRECGLEPKRLRLVQPSEGKQPNLILIEAMRGGRPGVVWEPVLVLSAPDGTYTNELKEIYHISE